MNFGLYFLFIQVDLFFLVMDSCHSKWSMNVWTLRVLRFPKMKALKAKKRTIQNPLFLSEEVTFQYLSYDRRLVACWVMPPWRNNQELHPVFCRSKQSCVTSVSLKRLDILGICRETLTAPAFSKGIYVDVSWDLPCCPHWRLRSLQGIAKFILQVLSTWFQNWVC